MANVSFILTDVESNRWIWSSPVLVAVVGLFATILANSIQNYLQGVANRALERQRFESTLIAKALDTGDPAEAAKRLRFLLDLGFIRDEHHKIGDYVAAPDRIPVQPLDPESESFRGVSGRVSRLSVGTKAIEKYSDLADLIASLPDDAMMEQRVPEGPRSESAPRLPEEQRNVHVQAYLYSYRLLLSSDFQLILGRDPETMPKTYMFARISGLPSPDHASYSQLKAARDSFEELINSMPERMRVVRLDTPIAIEVAGSLFFNSAHPKGTAGPRAFRNAMPTRWELSPVTLFVAH